MPTDKTPREIAEGIAKECAYEYDEGPCGIQFSRGDLFATIADAIEAGIISDRKDRES